VKAIRQGMTLLAAHADVDPVVEKMPPEFRPRPIACGTGDYIAFHSYDRGDVVILAVRPSREAEF
jgi:hypothetical protein